MKYIYLITSPTGKHYIGKCTIDPALKAERFQAASKYYTNINRPILNAIRKYGWDQMIFQVIERNDMWTIDQLNEREKYWIDHYQTIYNGYNVTGGGDGHTSDSAKVFWSRVTEQWKQDRAANCSIGQKARYKKSKDSELTRKRKSDSHKGTYQIESPDGQIWVTNLGLKDFVKEHANEIKISYWALINAYRKCYNNQKNTRQRKDTNNWKVIRIDKPTSNS